MFAITGITGHVGGATARELLRLGAPVRAIVRDHRKGGAWADAGAQVAVADFHDREALTAAFAGCVGAFVMLPTLPSGADAEHRELGDSIAAAVEASAVRHVVALSSLGAHLPEGTGPIRWLHHLEGRLRTTGAVVTAVRAPHFQEKVETVLEPVLGAGVYPVFGDSADTPIPMVATSDIGTLAAQILLSPPAASEVVDLDAPSCTERDVALLLGAALGRNLQVVTLPRSGWLHAIADAGVPPLLAAELVELHDADQRGVLIPCGDRRHRCTTGVAETLGAVVASRAHA